MRMRMLRWRSTTPPMIISKWIPSAGGRGAATAFAICARGASAAAAGGGDLRAVQGPLHGEDDASAVVSEAMREMVSRVALRHRRNQFISSADGSPVHHREDADAAGPMARGNANGTLPAHLERFIADEMLHGVKGKRVRQAVSAMRSQVSKAAGGLSASSSGRRAVHPRGQLEADAYVAGNLAGHYAIMSRIASEIRMRFPNFLPNRVMELCHSNTAVGTLACIPILQGGGADAGGTSIRRGRHADVTAVCESPTMRSSAMALLRAAGVAPDSGDLSLRTNVTWFRRMPSAARRRDRFDLVISAFSLSSLGGGGEDDEDAHVSDAHMQGGRDGVVSYTWSREQRQHLTDLWDHVAEDGMLILVENGNSDGCALMNSARGFLIESSRLRRAEAATPPSLHIVGPCPHENACPMSSLKRARCFFRQRFEPPGYRRALLGPKGKGFEEMSYSYLVLRKGARGSATTLADHGFDADELFSPRATTGSLESDGGVDAPDDLDGGYSSQALGMHGDIGDDVTHQLRSIVTDSANRDWSRIVKTPSREKKGFTRLELCTPTGDLRRVAYTKHRSRTESPGPEGYRLSRRVRQGDLWPFTGAARTEIVACAAEKTPSDRRGYRLQGDGDGRQRRRNRRRPVAMVEEARDALALRGQHQHQ